MKGLEVSRPTLSRWRRGTHIPPERARAALLKAFKIPVGEWDVVVAPEPAPPPAPVAPPAPPPSAPDPDDEDDDVTSAETLAEDHLQRCAQLRELAKEAATGDEKRKFLALEEKAIRLYASLSGQGEASNVQILRSAQWAKIKGLLVRVLEKHPAALAELEAVFRAEAGGF